MSRESVTKTAEVVRVSNRRKERGPAGRRCLISAYLLNVGVGVNGVRLCVDQPTSVLFVFITSVC